ncbi:flippase [Chloroflexota bacterium]
MSTVRSIAKNVAALGIAQVVSMGLSLVLVIFIARFIGDVGFGKLGFAQSFVAILVVFADIGMSQVIIREVARRKELSSKYLGNVCLIKLVLSVITFGLIALIINLMHYPPDTIIVVYLIGISSILGSLGGALRAIFRAFERMEFEAFISIGITIVTTGVGIAVLFAGYGLIGICLVYLFVAVVNLLVTLLVVITKFTRFKLEVDFKFWKQIILMALPFSVTAIIGLIYFQIDMVMLSVMKGDAVTGWYKAATTLIYSLLFIPNILSSAIFPVMSRFYVSSREALRTLAKKSAKYLFILGLPIAIGTILLADRIIPLFYGEGFSNSIIALQILSLYLPLRFINHVTAYTLASINKQPLAALVTVTAAAANVGLNLFLIAQYSLMGAAIATVMTEVIGFILRYYFVAKHFHRLELRPILLKPCLACLAMGVFVFYLKDIHLAPLIVTAAILYFGVLYIIKGFDREDKDIFKELKKGILRQNEIAA